MVQVKNQFLAQSDPHKKIILAAAAVMVLLILFPPKNIISRNPLLGQSATQSAGYQFIFADPSAEQKAAGRLIFGDEVDKWIYSSIDWTKLFVQLVIVGGGAYAWLWYTKRRLANVPQR